jgi:hypothetical protein
MRWQDGTLRHDRTPTRRYDADSTKRLRSRSLRKSSVLPSLVDRLANSPTRWARDVSQETSIRALKCMA